MRNSAELWIRAVARIRGDSTYRVFDEIRDRLFQPADCIESFQLDALRSILAHAHATTIGYRERMDVAGLVPQEMKSISELSKLAVTTKDDIRHIAQFMSSEAWQHDIRKKNTSGSTGVPLTFYRDRSYVLLGSAGTCRNMALAGWCPGHAIGYIWGYEREVENLRKRIKSWFSRVYYMNAFRQCDRSMEQWVRLLKSAKVRHLYGYPSSLYVFGQFVLEHGIDLPMNAVFCTAEKYFAFERRLIEKAFRCKSYDYYGSSEIQNAAFECTKGNMHVSSDFVVLEAQRPASGDAGENGTTEIIATSLHNRCMPFIRYETGDYGCLLDRRCDCGINTPLVRIDGGSKYDFLVTPRGTVHGAVLERVFNKIADVRRYQIVQHAVGRYTIRCEIARGVDTGSVKALVEKRGMEVLEEIMQIPVRIDFEYPERIEAGPGGKYRFVYREIQPEVVR